MNTLSIIEINEIIKDINENGCLNAYVETYPSLKNNIIFLMKTVISNRKEVNEIISLDKNLKENKELCAAMFETLYIKTNFEENDKKTLDLFNKDILKEIKNKYEKELNRKKLAITLNKNK